MSPDELLRYRQMYENYRGMVHAPVSFDEFVERMLRVEARGDQRNTNRIIRKTN